MVGRSSNKSAGESNEILCRWLIGHLSTYLSAGESDEIFVAGLLGTLSTYHFIVSSSWISRNVLQYHMDMEESGVTS